MRRTRLLFLLLLIAGLTAAETPGLPKSWALSPVGRSRDLWMFKGFVQVEATPGGTEPPHYFVADADKGGNRIPLVLADSNVIEGWAGKQALVTGSVLPLREGDALNVASILAPK